MASLPVQCWHCTLRMIKHKVWSSARCSVRCSSFRHRLTLSALMLPSSGRPIPAWEVVAFGWRLANVKQIQKWFGVGNCAKVHLSRHYVTSWLVHRCEQWENKSVYWFRSLIPFLFITPSFCFKYLAVSLATDAPGLESDFNFKVKEKQRDYRVLSSRSLTHYWPCVSWLESSQDCIVGVVGNSFCSGFAGETWENFLQPRHVNVFQTQQYGDVQDKNSGQRPSGPPLKGTAPIRNKIPDMVHYLFLELKKPLEFEVKCLNKLKEVKLPSFFSSLKT